MAGGRVYVDDLTVGDGAERARLQPTVPSITLNRPLVTNGFGSAIAETTTTPYAVGDDYLIAVDASAGPKIVTLPTLAAAPNRAIRVKKVDSSANTVTVNPGAATIDGAASFTLYSQYDFVEVSAAPTEWLITGFFLGRDVLQSDPNDILILDHSAGGFTAAANLAAAEVILAAQTELFSLQNFARFVVSIEVLTAGSATTLFLGARSSGQAAAVVTNPALWRYFRTDDIDVATGLSDTQPYVTSIPLVGQRFYTESFLVWGSIGSAIVWADDATGLTGNVYVQRFVEG